MKYLFCFLACLLGLQLAHAQDAGTDSAAQQFVLDNGLTLIIKPDRRAPTAVHMLLVRVGSMDEVDGTSGVAHALEHMMFKGSKALPPGEFSRRVAALGGWENAFTSRDYTGYHQQVPTSSLREVMRMEAERFAHNQWPDEEFTREIEVIKEERRMRVDDNPRGVLFEQLYATSFLASGYRRPVIGWMGDIESMTPRDVRDFWRQWYVPQNAAVLVLGDVDVAEVRAWAEEYYGAIEPRALPPRKPRAEPPQLGMRRITVQQPAEQGVVALLFHAPRLTTLERLDEEANQPSRDALALLVLSQVLSGAKGARLERALVQAQERLADSANSAASVLGRGPGSFVLLAVPAAGRAAAEVEAALRAEVAKIARDGVAAAELERVKVQWMAGKVYEKDSIRARANSLGGWWVQGLPLDADDRLLEALGRITAADVQRVAGRYFADDQLSAATLVPTGSRARRQTGRPDFGGAGISR